MPTYHWVCVLQLERCQLPQPTLLKENCLVLSQQLSVFPRLSVGLCAQLQSLCWDLFGLMWFCKNMFLQLLWMCIYISHSIKTIFPCIHPPLHIHILTVFLCLLNDVWALGGMGEVHMLHLRLCILLFLTLHLSQLWGTMLITFYCKSNLLSWRMRDAFISGYNEISY